MGILSGLIDSIFGSDDETRPTETLTLGTLSPEQQRIVTILEQLLTRSTGEQAQPLDAETMSLQGLEDLANQVAGAGAGASSDPTIQAGSSAIQGILSRGPTDFEDFFRTNVQDPALRDFERDIIPNIRERFAPQFFGGERIEAEGRATEDLLRLLTQARSGLAFQTQNQNTQDQLSAIGLAPQFGPVAQQLPFQALQGDVLSQLLGGAGGLRESLAGQDNQTIQQLLAFLNTQQQENVVVGGQTIQGQSGIFPGLLNTAGTFGLGSAFGVF